MCYLAYAVVLVHTYCFRSTTPRILPNSPLTPPSVEGSGIGRHVEQPDQRLSPTSPAYIQSAASISSSASLPEPPNSSSPQITQLPGPSCHPDYAFLQVPDTKDLLPQDAAFLVSQGCFIVPQRAALDDFLRQYFLHVHPMLPILNEKDFWLSYNSVDSDVEYQMPMLVLQGLLFISSGVRTSSTSLMAQLIIGSLYRQRQSKCSALKTSIKPN